MLYEGLLNLMKHFKGSYYFLSKRIPAYKPEVSFVLEAKKRDTVIYLVILFTSSFLKVVLNRHTCVHVQNMVDVETFIGACSLSKSLSLYR